MDCLFKEVLRPYGEKQDEEKREASSTELIEFLMAIKDSMEQFDIDTADAAMKELEKCRIPKECTPLLDKLRVCMADVMMEEVMNITEEMIKLL